MSLKNEDTTKKNNLAAKNAAQLIDVKTIVTFGILGLFIWLAGTGRDIPELVGNITLVVFSFYFGTQHQKAESKQT